MILHDLNRYRDAGLLILRIGLGLMYMFAHGWSKVIGGPDLWEMIGANAANVGLGFAPTFWGFMAAFAEFGGGLLLVLGLFFRPALVLLLGVMTTAAVSHIVGDVPGPPWHPIELGIVLISLFLIGPGRYSLDAKLHSRRRTGI